jgi:hypothetical protein
MEPTITWPAHSGLQSGWSRRLLRQPKGSHDDPLSVAAIRTAEVVSPSGTVIATATLG